MLNSTSVFLDYDVCRTSKRFHFRDANQLPPTKEEIEQRRLDAENLRNLSCETLNISGRLIEAGYKLEGLKQLRLGLELLTDSSDALKLLEWECLASTYALFADFSRRSGRTITFNQFSTSFPHLAPMSSSGISLNRITTIDKEERLFPF